MILSTTLVALTAPALAQLQGDWTPGAGAGYPDPKSENGTLTGRDADIDLVTRPTFTAEYSIQDNPGIELLAATPFKRLITLGGVVDACNTNQLSPTLSLNYHFPTNSIWKPHVDAGLNYTIFLDKDLSPGDTDIDDSFGVSLQADVNQMVAEKGAICLNVCWFDIDSDGPLDGTDIGGVEFAPFQIGLSDVHRF